MNTSDLLTLQTKLTDLNKRAREIAGKVKYHGEELLKLHAGEYNQCLSWDADFVTRNLKRHQDELEKAQGGLQALKSVIAELEAKRPEVNRYTEILDGLKGNVREVARNAIEVVIASEELGCWIPHGSRKVHGLVDKKGKGANWAAFKAAVAALDDQRSKATFIVDPSKVSPTVRKTLDGLNLDSATIRVCPIEYREVVELVNGKSVTLTVAILLWPKGTKHGATASTPPTATSSAKPVVTPSATPSTGCLCWLTASLASAG